MKRIIIVFTIFILVPKCVYANTSVDTNSILEEQQSAFGIKDFINQCENYTKNFSGDIDISDIFSQAVKGNIDNKSLLKKIIKKIGVSFTDVIQVFVQILVIVLIHSLLKSLTDGLENDSVAKIVYYVQYILIVTIIMTSFTEILKSLITAIENMVGFSQSLIPILISLLIFTGNIATSSAIEPIILFLIEFVSNFIKVVIIPGVSLITILVIVSQISDRVQINKLSR